MHHKQGQVTSTIKTTAIPLYKVKRSSLNHSRQFIPGITAIVSTLILLRVVWPLRHFTERKSLGLLAYKTFACCKKSYDPIRLQQPSRVQLFLNNTLQELTKTRVIYLTIHTNAPDSRCNWLHCTAFINHERAVQSSVVEECDVFALLPITRIQQELLYACLPLVFDQLQ